jgi:molybdopterin-containing oxidoreductase family membrane subunit
LDGVVEQGQQRFEEVSLVLAGLATFLVHFCIYYRWILLPTWMAYYYIFPPIFAGAYFRIAMVNTALIIMRKVSKLEAYITIQHIELMNIVIMITGSIVG